MEGPRPGHLGIVAVLAVSLVGLAVLPSPQADPVPVVDVRLHPAAGWTAAVWAATDGGDGGSGAAGEGHGAAAPLPAGAVDVDRDRRIVRLRPGTLGGGPIGGLGGGLGDGGASREVAALLLHSDGTDRPAVHAVGPKDQGVVALHAAAGFDAARYELGLSVTGDTVRLFHPADGRLAIEGVDPGCPARMERSDGSVLTGPLVLDLNVTAGHGALLEFEPGPRGTCLAGAVGVEHLGNWTLVR